MSERELKAALDGVVEDAVAVVGADLNVASETLLRSVLHCLGFCSFVRSQYCIILCYSGVSAIWI